MHPSKRTSTCGRWLLAGAGSMLLAACAPDLVEPSSTHFRSLTTTNFTSVQDGDIPILITVPHGGDDVPTGVSARTTSFSGFATSRELYLQDIALGVAARLDTVHGVVPYLVIGESDREYIDYNRDELDLVPMGNNEAYEDADANPFYDEYHSRIDDAVDDIKMTYTSGLLIDMHGNTTVSDKITRGTRNGDAIWELLAGYEVSGGITASEQTNFPTDSAAMAHDGDLDTKWTSNGINEWIEFDLGSTESIGSVEIAFFSGATRTFDFEIEVWDGSTWVVAYDGTNSQTTSDFEIYEFMSAISGSKVRLSCHGSNVSNFNYVKEIRIQEDGWDPILGPNSIWGELADAGYALEPPNSSYGTGAETTFIGGFTVDDHGSENGGLDAFQMEIGLDYRDSQGERDALVENLADAIYSYYTNY